VATTSGCEKAFLSLQRLLSSLLFFFTLPLDERDGNSGRASERLLSASWLCEREGYNSLTG